MPSNTEKVLVTSAVPTAGFVDPFGGFTAPWLERNPPRADTFGMPRWSLRDFWGKRTEKKALNPEMRDMLLKLDGVYEMPRQSSEPSPDAATEQQPSTTSQNS